MARDRVLQIRCSAAEMESLENFAQGWGGPVSAYVRKVLFGASPRVKGEEKMPSPKVQVIDEKSIPIALKQLDQFEREQDAKVNGVNPMSRGACNHKPFKRKDGLTVCEKCGVRL